MRFREQSVFDNIKKKKLIPYIKEMEKSLENL